MRIDSDPHVGQGAAVCVALSSRMIRSSVAVSVVRRSRVGPGNNTLGRCTEIIQSFRALKTIELIIIAQAISSRPTESAGEPTFTRLNTFLYGRPFFGVAPIECQTPRGDSDP